MYYLGELLDMPCLILTPLLVKMLGILCINIRLYYFDEWFNDLSNIFNRIDNQIKDTTQLDDICLASGIRELCEARDSGFVQFVDRTQICNMIDMLCTR